MAERDRERPGRASKDAQAVIPDPADPVFCEWYLRLFENEFPEKVQLVHATGPKLDRLVEIVDQIDYQTNQPKPPREKVVDTVNDILTKAQHYCDVAEKPIKFKVYAWNKSRGTRPYKTYLIKCSPEITSVGRAEEHLDEDVEGADAEKRFELAQLEQRRYETLFNDQHRSIDRGDKLTEGNVGLLKRLLDEERAERRRVEERQLTIVNQFVESQLKMVTVLQEFADKNLERQMVYEKHKFWQEQAGDTLNMIKGLIPAFLTKTTGKTIPGRTPEAVVITKFIKTIHESENGQEKLDRLTGKYENGKCIVPGVLTMEQVQIIGGVEAGELPVDKLDELIEGPNAITQEQIGAATQFIPESQIISLGVLLADRKREMDKRKNGG